jgi:hypothetical protein
MSLRGGTTWQSLRQVASVYGSRAFLSDCFVPRNDMVSDLGGKSR